MTYTKRFIEVNFPFKEVSISSTNEKYNHDANLSTLHIWWARRPLSASRATSFASLISFAESTDEQEKIKNLIIEISKSSNITKTDLLQNVKNKIKNEFKDPPKIIDPFAGGGSIPFENLRLGCDTYSNDYNPVSVLIQKCVLEYPQKFGTNIESTQYGLIREDVNRLYEMVKKYSEKIEKRLKLECSEFYPKEPNGFIPSIFLWAKTIPCQNPSCNIHIPLMGQYWIIKKENKKIALHPFVKENQLFYEIVGDGYAPFPEEFDPSKGSVKRAIVECPRCKTIIDGSTMRSLFKKGLNSQKLMVIALESPEKKGKIFRISNENDLNTFKSAEQKLEEIKENLTQKWGLNAIPDEPTPNGKGRGAERAFGIQNYGIMNWGSLFNQRQLLIILKLVDYVRDSYEEIYSELKDHEFAKAVVTYLAFILDRVIHTFNIYTRWGVNSGSVVGMFSRQAIPIIYDYAEANPVSGSSGSWNYASEWILDFILNASNISKNPAKITMASATELPYPDSFFDAVFTDPPYYDNIPYSYLSDYFYVWLKRTIGQFYPELFSTPLTPKSKEIVAYSNLPGGFEEGKNFFESMLKKAFKDFYRILKDNGICIIVYAHKSTEGWETLINSLLDSNLVITSAWPISTEMKGRLRAKESAALASSIYIIARKIPRLKTAFYKDIKEELTTYLNDRMQKLWAEGISGADFFISAIGISLEVFGKYEKIIDYEGNEIRANRFLEDVRIIVTNFAVKQILHNGFSSEISNLTRFYLLWRWNYGDSELIFDEANKLARACNISLDKEWGKSFIEKKKDKIKILGPKDRKIEDLKESDELIDILHKTLLLWEKSKRIELIELIKNSKFTNSELFYKVAQAISETLPIENKEKKLLDGFLAGKESLKQELKDKSSIKTLDNLNQAEKKNNDKKRKKQVKTDKKTQKTLDIYDDSDHEENNFESDEDNHDDEDELDFDQSES